MSSEKLLFIKNNITNEIDYYYNTFGGIYLFAIYKKNKWVFTYDEFDNLTSSILNVANDNHIELDFLDSNNNIPKIIPLVILFSEESLTHLIPIIDKYMDKNNYKFKDKNVKPISDVYDKFVNIGKNNSNINLFETNTYNMNQKNILSKGDFHISFWIDRPSIEISDNFDDLTSNNLELSDDENETGFRMPKIYKSISNRGIFKEENRKISSKELFETKPRICGNKNKRYDDYVVSKRVDNYGINKIFDDYSSTKKLCLLRN